MVKDKGRTDETVDDPRDGSRMMCVLRLRTTAAASEETGRRLRAWTAHGSTMTATTLNAFDALLIVQYQKMRQAVCDLHKSKCGRGILLAGSTDLVSIVVIVRRLVSTRALCSTGWEGVILGKTKS